MISALVKCLAKGLSDMIQDGFIQFLTDRPRIDSCIEEND